MYLLKIIMLRLLMSLVNIHISHQKICFGSFLHKVRGKKLSIYIYNTYRVVNNHPDCSGVYYMAMIPPNFRYRAKATSLGIPTICQDSVHNLSRTTGNSSRQYRS